MPLGFGLILGLIVIVLIVAIWTGSLYPYETLLSTIFGVALGWAALGYALWSEKAESSATLTE